jgi:hypothetical protein
MAAAQHPVAFPIDPLDQVTPGSDTEYRRRTVEGILESYHSSYDVLSEAVQNAVDAVEDAKLTGLKPPYLIEVTVNLAENWIGILDTGLGMTPEQVTSAFAPHVSFKSLSPLKDKRNKRNMYRGYKGVGLTFLAYCTDHIVMHSKQDGVLTKARMQYGRAWATGERNERALMVEDSGPSPLDGLARGTYVQVRFSAETRPKSLSKLAGTLPVWVTILRTKTAIGQVLLGRDSLAPLKVKLKLVDGTKTNSADVEPVFLYPHTIERQPPFRFLNLVEYHGAHAEVTTPPADKLRQDGLYLEWETNRIFKELTQQQQSAHAEHLKSYSPFVYAFVPYQGSIWTDLNEIATGVKHRTYLDSGLMIAVNRQRLADRLEINATRYETFSRNVFVIVHFDDAKPDQGRKTIEVEAEEFAQKIADRVVQYLAKQRTLLRPPGESPTPEQRQIEKDHADWVFNVRKHAETAPLHLPPATYISTPLTEQDVVGLFHQMSCLGLFPGIKVYATSQSQTYDCLIEYDCSREESGLLYRGKDENPLGVSPYTLGDEERFSTRQLTVEFKNNLDSLIDDVGGDSPKTFGNIDICVCWGKVDEQFKGYELEQVVESNLDQRKFPGVTHLLRRDGDVHVVGVMMLQTITGMLQTGKVGLRTPSPGLSERDASTGKKIAKSAPKQKKRA